MKIPDPILKWECLAGIHSANGVGGYYEFMAAYPEKGVAFVHVPSGLRTTIHPDVNFPHLAYRTEGFIALAQAHHGIMLRLLERAQEDIIEDRDAARRELKELRETVVKSCTDLESHLKELTGVQSVA